SPDAAPQGSSPKGPNTDDAISPDPPNSWAAYLLAGYGLALALQYAGTQLAAAVAAGADALVALWQKVADILNGTGAPTQGPVSPQISPDQLAGKTPAEIDQLARSLGLQPMGSDPMQGQGSYVDPVTGEPRIRIDANDPSPHYHVNDANGNPLDSSGSIVDRKSPAAHHPLP